MAELIDRLTLLEYSKSKAKGAATPKPLRIPRPSDRPARKGRTPEAMAADFKRFRDPPREVK